MNDPEGITMKKENIPAAEKSNLTKGIVTRVASVLIALGVQCALLFGAAGRIDWLWAWIFIGINIATMAVIGIILLPSHPETIAERGRPKEFKAWDKAVGGLWGVMHYLILPLAAGLDYRFGWTRGLGPAVNIAGGVVFAAGMALFGWAMITNSFFSTTARIQTDRGQTVCRSGPYRYVRHPGYVGAILQSPGNAILLGSLWALIPAAAAAIFMIARTALEDRMLQNELAGYRDFVRDVPYRLIPYIW
jgi:protein-S-isoprenylcysteine O-methyltransferase Ste14